jgi:tetrapyrrole methylase family protein / MazG family protein
VVKPHITVVGLGPGGVDLLTQGTLDAIAGASKRFLRTSRHPSAYVVEGTSFDELYDTLGSFDEVYAAIVERLVEVAVVEVAVRTSKGATSGSGGVLYAVPGSPMVAEHTVELLLGDPRVEVTIVPALSYVDLTWARLRIDPHSAGARLVDGMRFAEEAEGERGPLLVAQCHSRSVLSDIKCTPVDPPDRVVVLQRLGLPDESIVEIAWDDLDRVVEPDHLTSLWMPEMATPLRSEMSRLVQVMDRLRAECPWDQQQTHTSLAKYAIEEAYELAEAIAADAAPGAGDAEAEHLVEELGDLLFQTVFHACLGNEDGRFSLADVARVLSDKLIRRHPHVFGDVEVADADEVKRNWEAIKRTERGQEPGSPAEVDPMAGLSGEMPALAYAAKVLRRAYNAGFNVEPPHLPDGEVGDYLMSVILAVHVAGKDPEVELRLAAARLRDSVRFAVGRNIADDLRSLS